MIAMRATAKWRLKQYPNQHIPFSASHARLPTMRA